MRVLIVEDEAVVARRVLRLVREIVGDDLERLEHCAGLGDALERVATTPFDAVLLDLNLRGRDGFNLLREAVAGAFHTIVVSAHTDRALEAFELGVLDFVAKPFTKDRLEMALERVRGRAAGQGRLRQLAVRSAGSITLVPIDEVELLRAADDYTEIVTSDGRTFLHDKSLSRLEALLPATFCRVHRSYLVDLRKARELRSQPGSRYHLVLANGRDVPVGRTRVSEVRARLAID